uniref:IS3 family transposase n=1 Tax=Faecousia sp. TaxID=2952921 RepID=UPI004026B67E
MICTPNTGCPVLGVHTFEVFSKAISDYIDYYNNRRIQAKTKWMPPVKFREASMM